MTTGDLQALPVRTTMQLATGSRLTPQAHDAARRLNLQLVLDKSGWAIRSGQRTTTMQLAQVVGTVVSTRKEDALIGQKLLILEVLNPRSNSASGEMFVAIDILGAGIGETVLIARGGAAPVNLPAAPPVDARVIGIVNTMDVR